MINARAQIARMPLAVLASVVVVLFATAIAAANPLAEHSAAQWAGTYASESGVRLTLEPDLSGAYSGMLTIRSSGGESSYPVNLRESQKGQLEGRFDSGGDSFPLVVESGQRPNQIALHSDGNVFQLERVGGANPLNAQTASASSKRAWNSKQFRHPEGRFRLDAPASWEPILHSPDVLQFRTSRNEDIVMVLEAELEAHEKGQPLTKLVPDSLVLVNEFLAEVGIESDPSTARTINTRVGTLPGAVSRWQGQTLDRRFSILQGTVIQGDRAVLVFGTVDERNADLLSQVEAMFASLRMNSPIEMAEWANSSFASGRTVVINGERLSDAKLGYLEGDATGTIPDGQYWYDRKTGMVGQFGGPTLAFLAADLDFCPALSPVASGAETEVTINGRFLHPQDLAGLEIYFGPIQPNRYWMDSAGNYGLEDGPALGNLIQQIAAIQAMAAYQAQGQQGGYGAANQGGGYNEALYGGGSVYRHFPNLGASGTGVTVADAGGGDTIVSAGGVMWWPGK